MQPQQPVYGPPPAPTPQPPVMPAPTGQPSGGPNDPYSFITDPGKPARRNPFTGGSTLLKVGMIIGVIIVILVVLVGLKNILSGEKINKASLISVAQDQAELLHLTSSGTPDTVSQSVKNFSVTTQFSVTSEQSTLLAYLKSHGVKGDAKTLAVKQSAAIDSQLKAANAASTFDPTYASVMKDGLSVYQSDLKNAYNLNHGPKAQALLKADYDGVTILLKQLSSADTSI